MKTLLGYSFNGSLSKSGRNLIFLEVKLDFFASGARLGGSRYTSSNPFNAALFFSGVTPHETEFVDDVIGDVMAFLIATTVLSNLLRYTILKSLSNLSSLEGSNPNREITKPPFFRTPFVSCTLRKLGAKTKSKTRFCPSPFFFFGIRSAPASKSTPASFKNSKSSSMSGTPAPRMKPLWPFLIRPSSTKSRRRMGRILRPELETGSGSGSYGGALEAAPIIEPSEGNARRSIAKNRDLDTIRKARESGSLITKRVREFNPNPTRFVSFIPFPPFLDRYPRPGLLSISYDYQCVPLFLKKIRTQRERSRNLLFS
ncbi:hypothetical protein MIMGU_mgv1a010403mg [Erythranthe guttata]|uniref:Uncharacterized protein n=1 Tax=Erythranthe guttata TaxID=4155 RepID=A0A022PUG6_ERYGU|nr:hypothetical protein MIMGU_mgv1a010403mg [Erythranthe guttata]